MNFYLELLKWGTLIIGFIISFVPAGIFSELGKDIYRILLKKKATRYLSHFKKKP